MNISVSIKNSCQNLAYILSLDSVTYIMKEDINFNKNMNRSLCIRNSYQNLVYISSLESLAFKIIEGIKFSIVINQIEMLIAINSS